MVNLTVAMPNVTVSVQELNQFMNFQSKLLYAMYMIKAPSFYIFITLVSSSGVTIKIMPAIIYTHTCTWESYQNI